MDQRSPLKAAPLRNPGQSVEEEIQRVLDDQLFPPFMAAGIFLIVTMLEWWRWWFALPPMPWLYTVVAVPLCSYAGWKIYHARQQLRRLRLARDGERAVGQYLERLREQGYQVLHDLVGDRFNVDHVLVGPAGIFSVETKTLSKPARGNPEVRYDGQTLTVGGFQPERDPIIQAKAQAAWLRELIEEGTGKRFEVRALVVYPGWFVTTTTRTTGSEVLVLNPKNLPKLLAALPERLSPEDRKLVAYHLSRYARIRRK